MLKSTPLLLVAVVTNFSYEYIESKLIGTWYSWTNWFQLCMFFVDKIAAYCMIPGQINSITIYENLLLEESVYCLDKLVGL